jgi:hypothetical protein
MTLLFTARQIASLLAALGVGVSLAACGQSTEQPPTNSPAAPPESASNTPAASPGAYDISRVQNIQKDFPAGFDVEAHPAKTLSKQDVEDSKLTALTEARMDPPQCLAAVIPPYADPSVGTEAAGARADGDQGSIQVVAFRSPEPIPVSPPPAGCERVTISGSDVTGTAESVPAPHIEGVTTTAVKLATEGEDEEPEYIFTAALNDRTSVVVRGGADSELNPQQLMSDLLVKATAAVRGQ